ncbi:hypothetical protein BP5796_10225 [Coleophoma crateriformis]|uniref:Uncharacterized protein n=1 Tax=Coleophoma crateriformis TaxID=565419 RepID=A0A3D8QUK8_9HELO|nr:hypothetical protein BP5796_10225 [Coleophoma crateriformis]
MDYIFLLQTHPVSATLAAPNPKTPTNIAHPPNTHTPTNPPPSRSINAPAIGAPVKHENDTTPSTMPTLVPILLKSLAAQRGNAQPDQDQDGAAQAEQDERVERAKVPVRENGGNDPPGIPDAIEQEEDGEAGVTGGVDDIGSEDVDLEVSQTKEDAHGKERIRPLSKRLPFHELPLPHQLPGRESRLGEAQNDQHVGEHDEAHDAQRPRQPNARQQLLGDEREEHAASGAAAGDEGDGQGAAAGEVRGHETQGRAEDQAVADALADALREEDLPVGAGEGGAEDAQELEQTAEQEHGAVVAGVEGAAGVDADEVQQEGLRAADPGHG